MPIAHIDFIPASSTSGTSLGDAVGWYGACLWKNGQSDIEYIVCEVGSTWRLTAFLRGPHAHFPRSHAEYGRDALQVAAALCRRPPRWIIAKPGPDSQDGFSSWAGATSLFLCEPDFGSPSFSWCDIRRGDNGNRVPLFTIPLLSTTREELSAWCEQSCELNSLWLRSTVLEMPSYCSLADARGSHITRGREFCAAIECATHLPTFLDLKRYYNHASEDREKHRLCPGCGASWRHSPKAIPRDLHWFKFRCNRCRFVQQEGCSSEGARLARIGDWKKGKPILAASELIKGIKTKKITL